MKNTHSNSTGKVRSVIGLPNLKKAMSLGDEESTKLNPQHHHQAEATPEAPTESIPDVTTEATTKRVFDFDNFDMTYSLPPSPSRAPSSRSDALPFKALFDKMEPAASNGEVPSKAVPLAYFVEERGLVVPADGMIGSGKSKQSVSQYVRTKIRGQFNEWVKALPETRKGYDLHQVWRDGSKPEHGEPHMRFWLQKKV